MTCLKGEGLDGPGMKSHTSMLRTFFVYTLALSMPIFKKKSPLKRLGKSSKLFIVVTLLYFRRLFSIKCLFIKKHYSISIYTSLKLTCLKRHLFFRDVYFFIKYRPTLLHSLAGDPSPSQRKLEASAGHSSGLSRLFCQGSLQGTKHCPQRPHYLYLSLKGSMMRLQKHVVDGAAAGCWW